MKTAILFSGGKDSFFSLLKAQERQSVDLLISIKGLSGETQLHAGPESNADLRSSQIQTLSIPHVELEVHGGKDYLHGLFLKLNEIVKEHQIQTLVTGDLWHPYTSGIGDMLAGALGVELLRPAREVCTRIEDGPKYLQEVLDLGIESIIVSVRKGNLPESFVGRRIDKTLLQELSELGVDVAAEGGEYQSLVLAAPNMNKRLVIDEFSIGLAYGKNGKEQFHRMEVKKYHTEQI